MMMDVTTRQTQTSMCLSPLLSSLGVEDMEAHQRNQQYVGDPVLPGPFVVLQGMSGDGMANTIDFSPTFPQRYLRQNTGATDNQESSRQRPFDESGADNDDENTHSDDSSYFYTDYYGNGEGENRSGEVTQLSSNSHSTSSSFQQLDEENDDADFHHVQASSTTIMPPNPPFLPPQDEVNAPAEDSSNSSASAMLSSLGSSSPEQNTRQIRQISADNPSLSSLSDQRQSAVPQQYVNTTSLLPHIRPPQRNNNPESTGAEDSFVVVRDESGTTTTQVGVSSAQSSPRRPRTRRSREEKEISAVIRRWHRDCREREEREMIEFQTVSIQRRAIGTQHIRGNQVVDSSNSRIRRRWRHFSGRWWLREGRLVVFSSLPTSTSSAKEDGALDREVTIDLVGDLNPGCAVLGTEIIKINGRNLPSEQDDQSHTAHNVDYFFLRIESPLIGYVLYRCGTYNYIAGGLPTSFCQPNEWFWRVISPEGAYVRRGLELNSRHLATLPHGSLVKVTRKTVNAMGLSRLSVAIGAYNHRSNQQPSTESIFSPTSLMEGWVSEVLNPLSGQQGPIMQPLPFPVPALYRVSLSEGAVIRAGVELSSAVIRTAPAGSILKIVGRSFSEHPSDRCIERLRLAGEGGWVSVRLNRPPPLDQLIVELVGVDGSFNPEHPGKFHLYAQREVTQSNDAAAAIAAASARQRANSNSETSQQRTNDGSGDDNSSDVPADRTLIRRSVSMGAPPALYGGSDYRVEDRCLICLTEHRTATMVHGGTGHIACCLTCARILKARGDKCPVCRLPIDSVIQQFWA
mmetsp:Transcript_11968/g.14944  ORF Transcript_11968/g.14944 Transcript_11968/m.14944 type:complete len:799 (+) Transcript_11968:565-2961(+)|eukprot:CAMPEP_0172497274 /NCGR_PEP_ID=MMETSP1066-20121228/97480_1 /TAXON_ID=671091 /ORGANISM="Coscinodiscus wailesii, Strain CCMP2513" /LENGTH=798 /DNA_ID=CAMNT_0013269939 /DNA_START=561 /DNA_END=2957 /DNA_ORIENTATION=+